MDRELAQMAIRSAIRAMIEIGDLAPLIKQHGDDAEDEAIKLAIGSAVYEIGLLTDSIFAQHPDLKEAYEYRRNKYGRPYL